MHVEPHFTLNRDTSELLSFLTIIRRRQGEYCPIIPETKWVTSQSCQSAHTRELVTIRINVLPKRALKAEDSVIHKPLKKRLR